MKGRRESRQGELLFRRQGRGGKRKNAGRKRVAARRMVPHGRRPALRRNHPVHVTVRMIAGIPTLRRHKVCGRLRRCFLAAQKHKERFRVCQFSVQGNHIHLICEAEDKASLSRGMQGINIRIAKALNKLFGRKGRVLEERYHARILRFPRQVRNALCYVLQNARRHGVHNRRVRGWVDPFSSAYYFDGWKTSLPPPTKEPPVAAPATWLLSEGWRRYGPIALDEMPAAGR